MSVEKFISPFIQAQVPAFYEEYGPNFIAFLKAYYEWMESASNPLYHSRKMYEYFNVDYTPDNFITYFKNKYMLSLPDNIVADKRLLIKHIIDLYKSKGTKRAYELLFRILFNEDIEVYIPGDDIFKASDNKWIVPRYIEVSDRPYLSALIGKQILSSGNGCTAIVENYFTRLINNKVVNVLVISSLTGDFNYGQYVLCEDLFVGQNGDIIDARQYNALDSTVQATYVLALTISNAPVVFGSLSAIGVVNGGAGFGVGDLVKVNGDGSGAIARVAATTSQQGKVTFSLLDGGSGFSLNATVSVVGGYGNGATFKIGGIIDKEVIHINTDIINTYYNTALDSPSDTYTLRIANTAGSFSAGHTLKSSANTSVVPLDITLLVANTLAVGEYLSNSAYGITGTNLRVVSADQTLVRVTGSGISSANLTSGIVLISNTTSSVLKVNTVMPVQNTTGSANITFVNSSVIQVNQVTGYFTPGSGITDANSSANATVVTVTRDTNWAFPVINTPDVENLDTPISLVLTTVNQEVGTIAYLSGVNPGSGYSANPVVSITEPLIYALRIPSGSGYKGFNAAVNAIAGSANGIVTAVDIYDSGFGYDPAQMVTMTSTNTQNQTTITGTTVIDTAGKGSGYFKNRSGFLSDTQHVIDSHYYQSYSYDIIATRTLESYEKFVRDLVHPAGIALFGSYVIKSEIENDANVLVYSALTQPQH